MIRSSRRRESGLTLIELLITMTIVVLVMYGVMESLSIGIGYNEHLRSGRTTEENRKLFEARLTDLIHRAYIDPVNATSATTYFVGQTGEGMPPGQTVIPGQTIPATTGTTAGTTASTTTTVAGSPTGGSGNADTLMFTVFGRTVPSAVLSSTDDFETNNQKFGPQGGITEYAISTTAVGDSSGKTGLILREQVPADQDATQGGYESLLEADITNISFEFFDGNQWQPSWNTFGQTGTRRLPSAVRVDYTMKGESQDRIFIVRLPFSDVTTLNPATMTGGS